ncbi:MAG: peroxidase family protein [Phycisphaerales bacterium]
MHLRSAIVLAAGAALVVTLTASLRADVRTMNGSGNNIVSPTMGMAGTDLRRSLSGACYVDGIGTPMPGPNPRSTSNALSAQTLQGLGNARGLSSMAWQWGQFIDHDFALVLESAEDFNINIPAGDPVFDPMNTGTASMPFTRSIFTGGVTTPRQQQNALTHWLDGSMVYGSDDARAAALREGAGGRLATSAGNFLPFNTAGLPNAGGTSSSFYLAGDIRVNEQSGLLAMHTLFVREHNRLADQISTANPGLSDTQVYDRARRLVGAEIQAITYNEWLPAMLGNHGPAAYTGYNPSVDGAIDTAFSTAAFRIGHTMLNDQLLRVNPDGSTYAGGNLNLFQAFFNPSIIAEPGSFDALLRGLAAQQANEIDTQAIDGVRNLLFGGTNGRDLIALNIQRGRDHGLPDYNSLRADFGLARVSTFDEITSDASLASALALVFGNVDSIDPWIGLFAEDHLAGASLGPTAAAIFSDQFSRLRDADRFFYLNDAELTQGDLDFLAGLRLADIIRFNTGALEVQDNVFFIPAPGTAGVIALAAAVGLRRRRRA